MQITFIGTSHGVPEPNRKCSCAMIEIGSRVYFIDAGTNPIDALIDRGMHPDQVEAVFITHAHGDHTNGLIPCVDLLSWYFTKAKPRFYLPDMRLKEALNGWVSINTGNPVRADLEFSPVAEGPFYDDSTLKVTAVPTGHMPNAYSFILEAEGKKVLFTGDMHQGDGPLVDFARVVTDGSFDLAVAECAHFDANLYLEPLRKHPPKRFCLNHYSTHFAESCYHLKNTLQDQLNVELATDNYIIRL